MSNSYFRFKQFIVHQGQSAMKVCTDSCLFGAWMADIISQKERKNILDIGAGTGLLSLMLTQKNSDAMIDCVEADEPSSQQAKENCEQSSWKENIRVYHARIQDFFPHQQYDVIISNPPFYENDLLSAEPTKNVAHHHAGLTLRELVKAAERLLSDEGCLAVLLPYHRTDEFENLANKAGLFLHNKVWVKQTPAHHYFRSMCLFSKEKRDASQDEIIIKDERNQYTPAFISFLKDYYLYL